jgi:hypothetical protein
MIVSYRTEIPLTSGAIVPVSRIVEAEAYTYIDDDFVPTKIQVEPIGEQKLYRLRTINGRLLDVAPKGQLYAGGNSWLDLEKVPHTTRSTATNLNTIEQRLAEVGFFPRQGHLEKDPVWISLLRNSLFNQQEDIPTYLGMLDHHTLYRLLFRAYRDAKRIHVSDVFSRNRLFHLLARLGIHGKVSKETPKNPQHLLISSRGRQTFLKWHASRVHEFSDSFTIPAFRVTSEHGSFMETNLLCRTTD